MKNEELKDVWHSQTTKSTVQLVLLLKSIQNKTRQYNRILFLRNIREGWGTILAALIFVFITDSDVESRMQLWPWYMAMVILFGIGVFRVIDNNLQKRKARQYHDSIMSFITYSLIYVEHRIWLLENILWWWVLPVSVGGMLIIAQIILLVGIHEPVKLGIGAGIGCLVLFAVYWGNLLTARKYWRPRKAELESLYDSLKAF